MFRSLLAGCSVILVVAVVSARAAVPSAPTAATGPLPSSFYAAPGVLPLSNGQIIREQQVTMPTGSTPTPVDSWVVLYRSTTATGAPVAVSETVMVPTAPYSGGSRPVIGYAVGTQGWGTQCAPSIEMLTSSSSFDEWSYVNQDLAQGWAVALTDYQGLGTAGPEPYLVGSAEGHDVLDAVLAAESLPGDGLSASSPVGIIGYSQGGGAAGWAAQLAPTYAPSLRLLGVALGGTPANIQSVVTDTDGSPWMLVIAGVLIGFNAAYPSLDLSRYLNSAGVSMISQVGGECNPLNDLLSSTGISEILPYAGQDIESYLTGGVDPLTNPLNISWQLAVDENDLGAVAPKVPVFQWHGLVDEMVPLSVELNLHSQWCSLGVKSQLNLYVGDHPLAAAEGYPDAVTWMSNRFAGQVPPSNC